MDTLELIDIFKIHVRESFYDARNAHNCIFDEKCSVEIALAYLNKAISEHCCCESLYYAQYEILGRGEYEDYSHQFNVFVNELLTNVRTNHIAPNPERGYFQSGGYVFYALWRRMRPVFRPG